MVSQPSGVTRRTTPPSSSMCASIIIRGPDDPCCAITEPSPSKESRSLACRMRSTMILRTGSPNPGGLLEPGGPMGMGELVEEDDGLVGGRGEQRNREQDHRRSVPAPCPGRQAFGL